MFKKCTPLWREAHFEVKISKNTSCSEHFRRLRCGEKGNSVKATVLKTDGVGLFLEDGMLKNCTPLWREANFQVKKVNAPHAGTTLGRSGVLLGFCGCFKNDGRRGPFEEDLQRCLSRTGGVQETSSS